MRSDKDKKPSNEDLARALAPFLDRFAVGRDRAADALEREHRTAAAALVGRVVTSVGGGELTAASHARGARAAEAASLDYAEALRRRFADDVQSAAIRDGESSAEEAALALALMMGGQGGLSGEPAEDQGDIPGFLRYLILGHGAGLIGRAKAPLLQAYVNAQDGAAVASQLSRMLEANVAAVVRLGRTAYSYAWNQAVLGRIRRSADAAPSDPHLKFLVAIHDAKTAWDSLYAEAQPPRPLEDLFVDGSGRQYIAPPGRMHDRESMYPWRASWGAWPLL